MITHSTAPPTGARNVRAIEGMAAAWRPSGQADDDNRCEHEREGRRFVPAQPLTQPERGEAGEDEKRDDFLRHLQLGRGVATVAQAVGGDLQAVLEKGDRPRNQYRLPHRRFLEAQVPVPGRGHEHIRREQQGDRLHATPFLKRSCGPTMACSFARDRYLMMPSAALGSLSITSSVTPKFSASSAAGLEASHCESEISS